MKARSTAFAALSCALLSAAPATAQTTRLERDVEFVRKLATDLRFIQLAQLEVDNLAQKHRQSDSFKQVFQLGIEISLIGARSHPNREERRTLFKDALERSKEFIDRYPDEEVTEQARLTMVEACFEYGKFLLDEIELAHEEDPAKVKDLEAAAAAVYRDGADACDKIMEANEDAIERPGTKAYNDLFRAWFFKGLLLRENARAVKSDREPLAEFARDTLEEMIFEIGEHTFLGLRGFFEMSQIAEVLGDTDTAISDYRDTIDAIYAVLTSEDVELDEATSEALINLLQEAYDRAAEALFLAGRVDEVLETCEQFRAHLVEFGAEGADAFDIAHPTYGHPVFLTEARAMAESGQPDLVTKARAQAQRINDSHPNDIIGTKAKMVLKEILEIASENPDGALLFEVAKGEYQSREYEAALMGCKRAYAAMSDAQRNELGLELWTTMAKSYGLQGRYLEATLAACTGLERHGPTADAPETAADVLDQAWTGFRSYTKGDDDPELDGLKRRVTDVLGRYGGAGSEAELLWREANQKFLQGSYREAGALYGRIAAGTELYDAARGRLITSLALAGDYPTARNEAASYLQWLGTPAARIAPNRSDLLGNRQKTLASIAFYDAQMDYQEAVGATGGAMDPTRFEPTIAKFEKVLSEHPQAGAVYVPASYDMIARLYANLGRIDKAEEYFNKLRADSPNSSRVPRLATKVFELHEDRVKSLETELEAVAAGGDTDETKAVEKRLDEARRDALASGIDYMRNSEEPQYAVLWNSLQLARNLEDWKTVESIGDKIVATYGEDSQTKDKVETFVKPIVGESLLEQNNFREAVALLKAADDAATKSGRPNYPVKRLLARALGGWFKFNDVGSLIEVAGLDRPAEAYEIMWNEYRKYALHPTSGAADYTLPWYEFYFECFSLAKRAARSDTEFANRAVRLYRIARSTDDFTTLRGLGAEGRNLYQLFYEVELAR